MEISIRKNLQQPNKRKSVAIIADIHKTMEANRLLWAEIVTRQKSMIYPNNVKLAQSETKAQLTSNYGYFLCAFIS